MNNVGEDCWRRNRKALLRVTHRDYLHRENGTTTFTLRGLEELREEGELWVDRSIKKFQS